jgi:phage shock protein PspC (stress-responsive transcriptional regulator)
MVAGVAAGLARRFETPDWLPRVIFAITAFIGGIGVALYVAGWLLIRSEDETEPVATRFFANARGPGAWVGIGLVVLAGVILLDNLTFISGGVIWGMAILVVGVLLYMGQISIPRDRPAPTEGGSGDQTTTADTSMSVVAGATPPPATPAKAPPVPPPPARPPVEHSILGRLTLGFAVLAMGILAILDLVPTLPIEAEPRHYVALAMTVIGLGLVVGTLWGRARWLILIAVILLPGLFASSVAELGWERSSRGGIVLDASYVPQSFAQVQDLYSKEIGDVVIDLTDLPWDGEEIAITVRMDAGNLEILVPRDVGIAGSAEVDVGRVSVLGQETGGLGSPAIVFDQAGDLGHVDIDAMVDIGNIEIVRSGQ